MKKVAFALMLLTAPAFAHGTSAAWYGGQIAETDDLRIEFAIREGTVHAWVREHSDAAKTAAGKATLLLNGRKVEVVFGPDGQGLVAEAPVTAADRVVAVLSLIVDGKSVSARFTQEALVIPATLSPAAQIGKQAFDANCSPCHGTSLRGGDKAPPLLHPYYAPGSDHGDGVILAAMKDGAKMHMWKFGDMPKPEGLKAEQREMVLAYIRAMQEANGLTAMGPEMAPESHHHHHEEH